MERLDGEREPRGEVRGSGTGGVGGLAAVVLAAGAGSRLRPLTEELAKPLCPVAEVPLIDLAIERARPVTEAIAVNVHHHRDQLVAHLEGRVHLSVEDPEALGTAGAVGALRDWIDGRDVLVVNADAWQPGDLSHLVEGWDRRRVRLRCIDAGAAADFGTLAYAGACLLPWSIAARLAPEPTGLYEVVWRDEAAAGRLDLHLADGPFVDCGTPRDYLRANLLASGGRSVVGVGARVEGTIERCVLWPGAVVEAGEHLVEVVRTASGLTVDAPQSTPS